jgi:hypothetical protein
MKTILWLCAALLAAGSASAQIRYQCRTAGGSAYLSDRPCGSDSGMVYYGPSQSPQPSSSYVPRVGEAPGHLKYMSPRCAGLHDAIRTGPARGLKSETLSTMQRDYHRECGEDEAEARNQFSRDQRDQRQQKVAERNNAAQAQNQAKLKDQQCEEGKRILHVKKQRTDLNEGEKADLKRFEENYRARCG